MPDQISAVWQQITFTNFLVNVIFSLLISLLGKFVLNVFGVSPTRKSLYWIAVPAFVLVVMLLAEAASMDHPTLRGKIDMVYNIDLGTHVADTNTTLVVIAATIFNTGSPSTVYDWRLDMVSSQHSYKSSQTLPLVSDLLIPPVEHRIGIKVFASESMTSKTAELPIPHGGTIKGVIIFRLDDTPGEELDRQEAKITLRFRDVTGKTYSTTASRQELSNARVYEIPGLRSTMIPPGTPTTPAAAK
jgi:hypothetical protein